MIRPKKSDPILPDITLDWLRTIFFDPCKFQVGHRPRFYSVGWPDGLKKWNEKRKNQHRSTVRAILTYGGGHGLACSLTLTSRLLPDLILLNLDKRQSNQSQRTATDDARRSLSMPSLGVRLLVVAWELGVGRSGSPTIPELGWDASLDMVR